MSSGLKIKNKVTNFVFEYNSLINIDLDGKNTTYLQFSNMNNDGIKFNFSYKGNNV